MAEQSDQSMLRDKKTFLDEVYDPAVTPKDVYNLYEKYGTQYDTFLSNDYSGPRVVAECFSKIVTNRSLRILDCGAGTGLVGEELRRLGYANVDAIDMSETCLKIAHEKGVYKNIMCAKLSGEPIEGIKKDTYDATITCGCFLTGHLDDSVLTEWTRIVKPNGMICVLVNEKHINSLEGDIYRMLVENKKIEVKIKYRVDNYIRDVGAYFYSLTVLGESQTR